MRREGTILVMGGGIVGLSCAFRLRSLGHRVVLLETEQCGGQASGAAAGMLAAYSENGEMPNEFFRLCLQSMRIFPEWHSVMQRASGLEVEWTRSGSLTVAFHEADLLHLQSRLRWQNEFGAESRIVDGGDLFKLEPNLSGNAVAALHSPAESHVYAPDYVKAVEAACRLSGVEIHDRLKSLEWDGGSPIRMTSADGSVFEGDMLIVCNGAWLRQLEPALGLPLPVYPIRGQICAYCLPGRMVQHMIITSQGYAVYKGNGMLVCGASEDIAGFDRSVTEQGIGRLRRWAEGTFPFLQGMELCHSWAGLRPASQDGYPLIGKLPDRTDVIIAAGHYRNGILLSPVTAEIVAGLVDGSVPFAGIEEFSPDRFLADTMA